MTELAGLLVMRDGQRAFLPAACVKGLVPAPRLTRIPWDSAQMALVGGEVVAVLELGEPSPELVLCEVRGQAVALSGLHAERVGFWPERDSGVLIDGSVVPTLDLDSAIAHFQIRDAKEQRP